MGWYANTSSSPRLILREKGGGEGVRIGAPRSKIFPRFTDTLDGSEGLLSPRIMNLVPIASNCQPPARYLPPERGELWKGVDARLTSSFSISPVSTGRHTPLARAPRLYPWWQCKPKQTLSGTWAARGRQDILHSECTHTWRTIKGVLHARRTTIVTTIRFSLPPSLLPLIFPPTIYLLIVLVARQAVVTCPPAMSFTS